MAEGGADAARLAKRSPGEVIHQHQRLGVNAANAARFNGQAGLFQQRFGFIRPARTMRPAKGIHEVRSDKRGDEIPYF